MRSVRVQRHSSESASWEMVQAAPAPALRPYVRRFGNADRGYCGFSERSAGPMRRREVPSGEVALILSLGTTIDVRDADAPASSCSTLGAFVASLHDSASITEYSGPQLGLEVGLTPLSTYMILGVPMHELTNELVRVEEVLGRDGDRLVERLHEAAGWDERFAILDEFLSSRLADAREPSPGVAWAWGQLRRTDGRAAIRRIRDELEWSPRRLIREFREQVGLAPKAYARILRFDRVVRRLRGEGGERLVEIALDCGYYDQAHLNRDFRELAGITPSAYTASLLPAGGGATD